MRICAVHGCANSTYRIERWRKQPCRKHVDIHETGCCSCSRPFVLYPFPSRKKYPEARDRWTQLINRKNAVGKAASVENWHPTDDSRVCSKHFVDGKPSNANPDPTLHLGYKATVPKPRKSPEQRLAPPPPKIRKLAKPDASLGTNTDHLDYIHRCDCSENCSCPGCRKKQDEINHLRHENDQLREKLKFKPKKKKDNLSSFIKNDKNTKTYTGLPNRRAFFSLLNYVTPAAKKMTYWSGVRRVVTKGRRYKRSHRKFGKGRKLTIHDELLMVLLKLRQSLSVHVLSSIFNVSISTCSRIFNTWVKMLSKSLCPLVFWPDKQDVLEMLPPSLRKLYPQLRCTIDCTEIFIERPRHLELQAQTWSDYKKHNTVKFLVSIAPNGMINFLSKAWGGRASDRLITKESGFLDLVDPGDIILADRGFPIQEDLLLRRAHLRIPPPSSGTEQQMRRDVMKTKAIANARIHVERAIGRMKWFKIVKNTLPLTLVPLIDDIVLVCAALCNLLPPLVL